MTFGYIYVKIKSNDYKSERNKYRIMAKNKYSYSYSGGSNVKLIIIFSSVAVAAVAGVCGFIAYKTAEENQIAASRYEFNVKYQNAYDTLEVIDPEADTDKDGLNNSEENSLATKGTLSDTDSDGISDKLEANYGTYPTDPDSDRDGVKDGAEILAGLDPMKPQSDGTTPDAERIFTHTIEFDEGTFTLSGTADIFTATVEQLSVNAVASNSGALSLAYEIYCESEFNNAEITFEYNNSLVNALEINTDDIKLFSFNPKRKDYTEIESSIDTASNTISAPISENGVYVVGVNEVIQNYEMSEDTPINIHLLIDNSGSMYPSNQGYQSEENDVKFKRLTFAINFISKLGSNADISISTFTSTLNNMCEFTPDKGKVVNAINAIRGLGAGYDGTSVERAIMTAIKGFEGDMLEERNIIILLTDGISTDTGGYTLEKIASAAQAKNITVMTISLGDEYDRELLQSIADHTGGNYFQISEADILEGLYHTLLASMKDDIVDDDMDGEADSYTLYDTGFTLEEHAFSFDNFKSKTNDTLDFGMVTLARDWFVHATPTSAESDNKDICYNFEGTTIDTTAPLKKVFLQSMTEKYLDIDNCLNFLSGGETLEIDHDIANEALAKGWSVRTVPYSSTEHPDWNAYEILYPNHTTAVMISGYGKNDYEFIRAIHYYDSFRDTGRSFTLNSESDLNRVKKLLGEGTPIVTKLTWTVNGDTYSRYVLVTALRRNLDNPNSFNLKIYDVNSNSPTTVTLNRTCKINGSGAFTSDFTYSAQWDGKLVSTEFFVTEIN